MAEKPTTKRNPWSLRHKLVTAGIVALTILALALGLGLGLTLGGDDGNDDNDGAPTLTPLPSPNTTLSWKPMVNDTWQIILSHPLSLSPRDTRTTPYVSVFDIDLFDTPADTIEQLHALGKKVICYFSAGSYEEWRTDAKNFNSEDLGKALGEWAGERWLKLSSSNVRDIMAKRISLARDKGCDGVDPDNVDGYQNDSGFSLTSSDSIDYMQYLSSVARPLNLTLGLKNAGDIIAAVLPIIDFSVNEQCLEYNECAKFRPIVDAGKPVFHIEYPAGDDEVAANGFNDDMRKKFCRGKGNSRDKGGSEGFSTVLKKMELDGWVEYCDGTVAESTTNNTVGGHGNKSKR